MYKARGEDGAVLGTYDHYIGGDHAWGGGGDIKYFFCRYVGLGFEGFALDASKPGFDIFEDPTVPILFTEEINHDHTIGSVLGTLTLRYPIRAPSCLLCLGGEVRFSAAAKGYRSHTGAAGRIRCPCETDHFGSETKVVGQFGAGLEVRFSRQVGWTNDLSFGVNRWAAKQFWNVPQRSQLRRSS
jgi:hypothetical protein